MKYIGVKHRSVVVLSNDPLAVLAVKELSEDFTKRAEELFDLGSAYTTESEGAPCITISVNGNGEFVQHELLKLGWTNFYIRKGHDNAHKRNGFYLSRPTRDAALCSLLTAKRYGLKIDTSSVSYNEASGKVGASDNVLAAAIAVSSMEDAVV